MIRNITRKEPNSEAASASPEVDFALVLSRMIDSVNADPKHLRTTVYELARHKLQEQITNEVPDEISRLTIALEAAIQGVETHFSRLELLPFEGRDGHLRLSSPAYQTMAAPKKAAVVGSVLLDADFDAEPAPSPNKHSSKPDRGQKTARRRWEFTVPWRYLTVLAVVMAVVFAIDKRVNPLAMLWSNVGDGVVVSKTVSNPVQTAFEQIQLSQSETAATRAGGILPTTFGVYAVSDGKLYPLELLPGRAPNPRVAISPAISTASKTMVPDRRIKFIVFRRDSAINALERAEVRIIAKIAQSMKFDPAGKPIIAKADDSWVIRNISYPYQTAPLKGQPDMYEVLGEDADKPLEPGRYALVLKGEAYDFSIAGEISDSRQCLESVAAANGAFYIECQKR
jgi:flagellar hook-basal body complex protein FliE